MVTKRSAKDLDMSETVNRLESVTDRNIVVIVKFVLVALIIAVLNRLLLLDVKTESIGTFVLANIKTWVIALAAIFATTVGLIYGFSIILTRRTKPTTALKKQVVKAFQQALDESSFNPHPLNKHEQRNT
jgi:hypothetical protein